MNPVNLGPDPLLAGERAASMGQCNAGRAHRRVMSRSLELSSLFLRIALGTSFLSAVADRLGLWGGFGQPNVSWGSFARFIAYTATLNWFLPKAVIPALAIMATCAEVLLGLCLIVGWQTRVAAWGAGILLTTFAITMAAALGFKAPLDFSVFSAAGGAPSCELLEVRFSADMLRHAQSRVEGFNRRLLTVCEPPQIDPRCNRRISP